MPVRAMGLSSVVVVTVANLIAFIRGSRIPTQIYKTVVFRVIVVMARLHAVRTVSDKGLQYETVNSRRALDPAH